MVSMDKKVAAQIADDGGLVSFFFFSLSPTVYQLRLFSALGADGAVGLQVRAWRCNWGEKRRQRAQKKSEGGGTRCKCHKAKWYQKRVWIYLVYIARPVNDTRQPAQARIIKVESIENRGVVICTSAIVAVHRPANPSRFTVSLFAGGLSSLSRIVPANGRTVLPLSPHGNCRRARFLLLIYFVLYEVRGMGGRSARFHCARRLFCVGFQHMAVILATAVLLRNREFLRTQTNPTASRPHKKGEPNKKASNDEKVRTQCPLRIMAMQTDATKPDAEDDAFGPMPDELVLAVMLSADGAGSVMRLGATCRRMLRISADADLWRRLCLARHSQPLPHRHFAAFGKDWKWVYRALLPLTRLRRKRIGRSVGKTHSADADTIDTYSGDFRRTARHGYGWISRVGLFGPEMTYEGEWHQGLEHGRGRAAWSDGSAYEGDWVCGRRHGRGIDIASDGAVRDGLWCDDRFIGPAPRAQGGLGRPMQRFMDMVDTPFVSASAQCQVAR